MSRWNSTLDVSSFYHSDDLSIAEKARLMSVALLADKRRARSAEVQELAYLFLDLSSEPLAEADDFDYIMSDLYDWADENRVWVQTIVPRKVERGYVQTGTDVV